jgi:cytochrome c oxidase assembly protein subunit 15
VPKTKTILALTTLLAFCVIVFGAYVRLTDAGLGCPDWPGCYGFIVVPDSVEELSVIKESFPNQVIESGKAWREMLHRYIASLLGLLILTLFASEFFKKNKAAFSDNFPLKISLLLLLLVVFQGLLGMWTVTLKVHPLVVLAHLVGGLSTLSLLFIYLKKISSPEKLTATFTGLLFFGLTLLIAQIMLGGWTSTNYAALGCPDLPLCYGQLWPSNMDIKEGFLMWQSFGKNYEGGLLSPPGRTAIHFFHRLGAVAVTLGLGVIIFKYLKSTSTRVKNAALVLAVALLFQLVIGIVMVWSGIALSLATAHNAFAALLLLSFLNLVYTIKHR